MVTQQPTNSGLFTSSHLLSGRAPPQIADPPNASASTTFSRTSFSFRWHIDHFSTLHRASYRYNAVQSPTFTSGSGCNDTSWQLKICISPSNQSGGSQTGGLNFGPVSHLSQQCNVQAAVKYIGRATTQRSTSFPNIQTFLASITVECSLSVLGEDNSILKTTGKSCTVLQVGEEITTDLFEQKEWIGRYVSREGRLTVQCHITTIHHQSPIDSLSSNFHFSTACPEDEVKKLMEKVFYSDTKYADVTLVAEQEEFKAHKHMLTACSDVFQRMFEQPMMEASSRRVKITDVRAESIRAMLEFIYTGQIKNCDRDMAASLLAVAEKYNIQPLKATSEKELHRSIDVKNVIETLHLAKLHNSDTQLQDACIKFIARNMAAVKRHSPNEWQTLMVEHAHELCDVLAGPNSTTGSNTLSLF